MPGIDSPRIGLFGGTFDPIHIGHLIMAEDALRETPLDRVVFIPSPSAPLREDQAETSGTERLEMVRAAVAGYPDFAVDDFEVRQNRRVYSIETVRHYERRYPKGRLFFLIGGDQVRQLGEWRNIDELKRKVTFICARREEGNQFAAGADLVPLTSRRIDISATEIRRRFARGEPARTLLPPPVHAYIEKKGLYRRG